MLQHPDSPQPLSPNGPVLVLYEFVLKITDTIRRSRVASLDELDMAPLFDGKNAFWKLSAPVYVDIFHVDTSVLFERWALTFSEAQQTTLQRVDRSELILLTQSLYSFLRLLPAHGSKDMMNISYRVWSNGTPTPSLRPFDDETIAGARDLVAMPAFSVASKLKAYKFKTANVPGIGKLSISVLFDSNPRGVAATPAAAAVLPPMPGIPWDNSRELRALDMLASPQAESPPKFTYIDYDPDPAPPRPSPMFASPASSPPSRASSPMPIPRPSSSVNEGSYLSSSRLSVGARSRLGPGSRLSLSVSTDSILDEREERDEPRSLSFRAVSRKESESFGVTRRRSSGRLWGIPPGGGTPPWPLPLANSSHMSNTAEPFGTLVGSYEESLLTGRMSALPSHPVVFECQIGVIGTYSKCPPQLRCPPHVNVSFPAYFYELPGQDRSITPYVGVIDLDSISSAAAAGLTEEGRKVARREGIHDEDAADHCGYRIPMKGQLQIIIKNPSLTAIKVFLVPYDFRDMPVGTKTFLRQKSYAVPVNPVSVSDAGLASSQGSASARKPPAAPLRYAIHLHFACPSRRRLYLCRSMRVVFSPRGNDSEEKLQVVVAEPDESAKFTALELPFGARAAKRSNSATALDTDSYSYSFSNLVL